MNKEEMQKMMDNIFVAAKIKDKTFQNKVKENVHTIHGLYAQLYPSSIKNDMAFKQLLETIVAAHANRSAALQKRDAAKNAQWFLSNQICGMSFYVDRFAGNLKNLRNELSYFKDLGVNFLHLMPVMESPAGESDGGYAVSNFRAVDERFGTMADLQLLQKEMHAEDMYLMLDIVLNHTSHKHEWAMKAKAGDAFYQDFFYMYDDRRLPDAFEQNMPEIFPEAAPGSFTFVPELNKWVMTVFHNYQWDLNFSNPQVLVAMLDTIFFYANLGVDILRIDAPAFIWKKLGTVCQNLPEAHTLLRLIKLAVQTATPGMALLGEAIVAPKEIMKYFGTDDFVARECDVAYAATNMALQWDALATGDVRIMLAAQEDILQKPFGTTWITYTRCHDDIGLGYDDHIIAQVGFSPFDHRNFLKEFYSGNHAYSTATGALFSVNPKTNDARISGTLASLCGLEKAMQTNDPLAIETSLNKILMMQAHSFFLGGIPMLFYGDEQGYTNDYSYLQDPGKSYDNRWMHRPIIDWRKIDDPIPQRVFKATKKLLGIRKQITSIADNKNISWLPAHNIHVAGYVRQHEGKTFYGIFNFSNQPAYLTWYAFKQHTHGGNKLFDHWQGKEHLIGQDHQYLVCAPYQFYLFEIK